MQMNGALAVEKLMRPSQSSCGAAAVTANRFTDGSYTSAVWAVVSKLEDVSKLVQFSRLV